MSTIQQEFPHEDSLKYPYKSIDALPATISDLYNRESHALVSSLSRFGHRILSNQASVENANLRNIMATITRFCNNTTLVDDFSILMQHYPPTPMKSRIVLHSNVQRNDATELLSSLDDIHVYQQIVIVHQDAERFTIYLIQPSQNEMDLYFIGDNNFQQVREISSKIEGCLYLLRPTCRLNIRHRLQIPSSFITDSTVLAFILLHCLHAHSNYLLLNTQLIAVLSCTLPVTVTRAKRRNP